MASLNKVQLIGNLTAQPEVRETPNGQKVANFSIATNRTWKDAAGMKQEQVEFHNIVAWGFLADLAERYMSKGKQVFVEGRLQTRSWDDPTGAKKYKTEIVAENVILLGGGDRDGNSESYSQAAPEEVTPTKSRKATPKAEEEINIEDIPF